MGELAVAAAAALSSLAGAASGALGGGTAAATTAAAGAAGAGSMFAGASPSIFASILQGGTGLVGAMGAMRQGQSQAAGLQAQATTAEMDATQQGITATNSDNTLKRQLVATLGQRDVAYGASGVDLSFGTPAVAHAQEVGDAAAAMGATDASSSSVAAQLRARAALYRGQAGQASQAGDLSAIGDVVGAGAKILARG